MDHCPLLFFGANEIGECPCLWQKKLITEIDYQGHTCTTMEGRRGPILIPSQSMRARCRTTWLWQVCLRLLRFSPVSYNSTNAPHSSSNYQCSYQVAKWVKPGALLQNNALSYRTVRNRKARSRFCSSDLREIKYAFKIFS
jgi:hypothetical protein